MMFVTSVKCFYVCIIHRRLIVIGSKTKEKMDPEQYYPPSINSDCILSYFRSQCTIFSVECLPCDLVRTDLSLAILKTRTCLLIFIILLNIQLLCFPAGQGLKKVILVLFER